MTLIVIHGQEDWGIYSSKESDVERVMGFEPTTLCLGSRYSTTELHPHVPHCRVRCGVL